MCRGYFSRVVQQKSDIRVDLTLPDQTGGLTLFDMLLTRPFKIPFDRDASVYRFIGVSKDGMRALTVALMGKNAERVLEQAFLDNSE